MKKSKKDENKNVDVFDNDKLKELTETEKEIKDLRSNINYLTLYNYEGARIEIVLDQICNVLEMLNDRIDNIYQQRNGPL